MKKSLEDQYDASLLYQNMKIPESDCFGKEFDTHAFECSICSARAFCQTIKHETNKKRVKQLEEKQPFFDLVNYEKIDKQDLVDNIEGVQYEEVVLVVTLESKGDRRLTEYWLEIVFKEYGLKVENGRVCKC